MKFFQTTVLSQIQILQLLDLWNDVYPEILGYKILMDFESYLDGLREVSHTLVLDENGTIKGWYFDFNREHEKWFVIIIAEAFKRKGLGTRLLDMAKKNRTELNGWVINHNNYLKKDGSAYKTPLQFYIKNGFVVLDEKLENRKIVAIKIRWKR